MRTKQHGFRLIECALVIVDFGMVAANLIPRSRDPALAADATPVTLPIVAYNASLSATVNCRAR